MPSHRFLLQCEICKETTWTKGVYEEDTNAVVLIDPHLECGHGDNFIIIDEEEDY